jgi:hypothetical protein
LGRHLAVIGTLLSQLERFGCLRMFARGTRRVSDDTMSRSDGGGAAVAVRPDRRHFTETVG